MSESFRAYGLKADYLTAAKNEERDVLNRKLAKGEINYLFVVDIFNEGVDIPGVNMVLFLRPTDSQTIFSPRLEHKAFVGYCTHRHSRIIIVST